MGIKNGKLHSAYRLGSTLRQRILKPPVPTMRRRTFSTQEALYGPRQYHRTVQSDRVGYIPYDGKNKIRNVIKFMMVLI